LILFPGLIDANCNLQNNPKENWEGYDFGTKAAISGGVTTLVDLPVMKKPTLTNVKHLKWHIKDA
jgi:allantoinase